MLAACGSDGGDQPAGDRPTALTVREYDGERLVRAVELACGPDDVVCAEVVALLPRLRPDPDEVCTMIYGGPERFVVTGTVEGEPVEVEVTRTDGCQIARFDLLRTALAGG